MTAAHAIHRFPGLRKAALKDALAGMASGRPGRRGRPRHGLTGADFLWTIPLGGPPFGRGGPFRRGPKARRGDVRTAALLLLAEGPRNGYQIIQDIEERTEGVWRPSPGSVYPALQQLEDEGLVHVTDVNGRRQYELTDVGRAYVEERGDELPPPWEEIAGDVSDEAAEAGGLMRDVHLAFVQVLHAGTPSQIAEASKVLADTRRSIYRILAEGDPAPEEGA